MGAGRDRHELALRILRDAPVAIVVLDSNARIEHINPFLERRTGYRLDEVRGQDWFDLILPEGEREPRRAMFRQMLAGEAGRVRLRPIWTRAGERLMLEGNDELLRDDAGEVTGAMIIGHDVTDRVQIEEHLQQAQAMAIQTDLRLRQREAHLAAVFDHTSDAMLLLSVEEDGTLRVAAANRSLVERLNLMKPVEEADLIGLTMEQLALDVYRRPPEVLARYLESLRRVATTRTPLSFEHSMVFPTGPFFAEVSIVPVLDDAGACVHLLWSSRDVTGRVHAEQERSRLEDQLRQAQKMESLGTLAGGIAHDFNNLLAVILMNLELVRAEVGPGPVAESLESIGMASARGHELVKQILAFSRKQPTRRSVSSVRALVQEAATLLRATIPAGIQIVLDVDRAVPNVLIDPTQIHQVLMNLATNAWLAIERPTGTITLRLDTATHDAPLAAGPGLRGCVRLRVSDDGVGMDASTQQRIFEPFFTTRGVGKGTGLGLAVAHGIVANHGGAIIVDSAQGQGTTFSVYLPVTTEEVAPVDDTPEPLARAGGRVLLVDDEEQLVRVGAMLLERFGYEVTGFVRPDEALAAIRADPRRFDVIVTDRNMPGMGGLELARAVATLRPDLPVVLISGHSMYSDEELAGANVRQQLSKPFTSESLGRALASVMRG